MSSWTSATIKVNGVDQHFLRTGKDRPPVVLLHGLMTSGACWTPLARALEEEYDVIMPDARGHGKSGVPIQGYNYENLALDISKLIQALHLELPVLLGHSMGGLTAALVARNNPMLLRGLILADPTFLTPQRQQEVFQSDIAGLHQEILNRSREDYLNEARTRQSRRSLEVIELLAEARFETSMFAMNILIPPNPVYEKLILSLRIPSLLVMGDVGAVVSTKVAAHLSRINQRVDVVQISEAGHGLPYDQPLRFSVVVKKFLDYLL